MRVLTAGIIMLGLLLQSGCQNLCGGGYPMQSITRVPPPGTGSYPMQGGYYNNPMGAQSNLAPGSMPAGFAASQTGTPGNPQIMSAQNVVPAQYTAPAVTSSIPANSDVGMNDLTDQEMPDGLTGMPTGFNRAGNSMLPSHSTSPAAPGLQWQGLP